MENNEDLITIGEVAELLGVSIMTLRRWDESGQLVSVRKKDGGNRYYRKEDVQIFLSDLFKLAKDWAIEKADFPESYYCQNSAVFQARIMKMQDLMARNGFSENLVPLVSSVAGEIGNNSFDHNLAQWPDVSGIFFGYDLNKKQIVLADRGLGILHTLKRVRPSIENSQQALEIAFTEILSGRAPEERGNGLKYVRSVIAKNAINMFFQTGDAVLNLVGGKAELKLSVAPDNLRGCLTLMTF